MHWFRRSKEPAAPYEADLRKFADRVDRLSTGDVLFLRAAASELDAAAVERARVEVSGAIDRSGRRHAADDLDQSLVRWVGGSTPGLGTVDWIQEPNLAIERDTRRQGLAVLRDIGNAILVRDLVPQETSELLSQPWRMLHEGTDTEDR
jgi:hypothetical protein